MKTGHVHISTGDVKGKTTIAAGLAVRTLRNGFRAGYACFRKQPDKYRYTEMVSLERPGAFVKGFAMVHPFDNQVTSREEVEF